MAGRGGAETAATTMNAEVVESGRTGCELAAAPRAILQTAPVEGDMTETGTKRGQDRCGRRDLRPKASPLARRRARAAGISLLVLTGSGPGGRILARDVAEYAAQVQADGFTATVAAGAHSERAYDSEQHECHEQAQLSGRRGEDRSSLVAFRPWLGHIGAERGSGTPAAGHDEAAALAREIYAPGSYVTRAHGVRDLAVANHLDLTVRSVPQMTLHAEVRLGELEQSLKRMNVGVGSVHGEPLLLTVSDVLVKAMGLALRQVPQANVSYTRAAMLHHGGADVAVGLLGGDDIVAGRYDGGPEDFRGVGARRGLVLPVIMHADLKPLSEISRELQSLRRLTDEGRLQGGMPNGGVTTVYDFSDSGINGCEILVMPPQSSALVLGVVQAKAIIVDGAVMAEPVAQMSLSFDLRAFDMQVALRLMRVVSAYMEDPMRMLV